MADVVCASQTQKVSSQRAHFGGIAVAPAVITANLWIDATALWISCPREKELPYRRANSWRRQKESLMSDNRSGRRRRFRSRVAGAYEVINFARKHSISRVQAERIITRARGSYERAEAIFTLIKKEFLAA